MKQKTASQFKRSPPQLAAFENNWTMWSRKSMTTDTIPEGIMMNEGVENTAVHFDFGWMRVLRLQNTVGPGRHNISSFNGKCKFA